MELKQNCPHVEIFAHPFAPVMLGGWLEFPLWSGGKFGGFLRNPLKYRRTRWVIPNDLYFLTTAGTVDVE